MDAPFFDRDVDLGGNNGRRFLRRQSTDLQSRTSRLHQNGFVCCADRRLHFRCLRHLNLASPYLTQQFPKSSCPSGMAASTPALLGLAPELRMIIYTHALSSEHPIAIDAQLRQPALLLPCRGIRTEASPIWVNENRFSITIKKLRREPFAKIRSLSKYSGRFSGLFSLHHDLAGCGQLAESGRLVACPLGRTGRLRPLGARLGSGK